MKIRSMTSADSLMPFVLAAMNWRDGGLWTERSVLADPQVAHYVTDWMREGDAGVIAHVDGAAVGANDAARRLYYSLGFDKVGRVGDSDTLMLRIA